MARSSRNAFEPRGLERSATTHRRDWLRRMLAGTLVLGSPIVRLFGTRGRASAQQLDPALIVRQDDPLNAETPVRSLEHYITPNELFFIRSHYRAPEIEHPWRLSIEGMVERPLTFSLDELDAMETKTITAVLQCSGNGRAYFDPKVGGVSWVRGAVGNAEWTGVRLRDLLEKAGLAEETAHIRFQGTDRPGKEGEPPFFRSLPLERAMDPTTLVAFRMNGEPLPRYHGGPLRLVVPDWTGNHWMKWLTRIEASRDEAPGHFQQESYRVPKRPIARGTQPDPSTMATITVIPVKSLIARPSPGERIEPGLVEVVGVAFSGEGDMDRVEVAVGPDGDWAPAELFGPDRPHAWRLWRYAWNARQPGRYELRVRATDSTGHTQPDSVPWNPKGYLWNAVDRVEVRVMG